MCVCVCVCVSARKQSTDNSLPVLKFGTGTRGWTIWSQFLKFYFLKGCLHRDFLAHKTQMFFGSIELPLVTENKRESYYIIGYSFSFIFCTYGYILYSRPLVWEPLL